MTVRGVEHEHIGAGLDEAAGATHDVAVDADRRGDAKATLRIQRGRVDARAQRVGLRERADELAVAAHRGKFARKFFKLIECRSGILRYR